MTIKAINKKAEQLVGKELGKKLIRDQMSEWFAESRAKKERFMKKKSIPTPISQEEIDEQVRKFLEKGGKIQKLDPFDTILLDEEDYEDSDYDELNDENFGIKKILSIKINEMRY